MGLLNISSGTLPFEACILGIGAFDGVHRGHQALIREMINRSHELGLPSVIFTFDHPPRRFFEPRNFPGEITTPEEKLALLDSFEIDWTFFQAFEKDFSKIHPEEFVKSIIQGKFNSRAVFIGFNFRFGQRQTGDAGFLAKSLSPLGIECRILPSISINGEIVSSSLIRERIQLGDFQSASKLLGREPSLSGKVIHGDKRGREMGFPTANIDLEETLMVLPPHGVYIGIVETPQGVFNSIINMGIRPTFGKSRRLLEAHILDFNHDLYDSTVKIRFLKLIRREVCFSSRDALTNQIKRDLQVAKEHFQNISK